MRIYKAVDITGIYEQTRFSTMFNLIALQMFYAEDHMCDAEQALRTFVDFKDISLIGLFIFLKTQPLGRQLIILLCSEVIAQT